MPVRVIGMIGVAPPSGEATVHIIKGGISPPYLRSYAHAPSDPGAPGPPAADADASPAPRCARPTGSLRSPPATRA